MAEDHNLSQAEIWDDRELQAQWNTAITEYKKYHSVNAKGEDVAEVLQAASKAEHQTEQTSSKDLTNGVHDGGSVAHTTDITSEPIENGDQVHVQHQSFGTRDTIMQDTSTDLHSRVGPPLAVMESIHDKSLKDLMMSWYWAGYYTGFHEGQQSLPQRQPGNSS